MTNTTDIEKRLAEIESKFQNAGYKVQDAWDISFLLSALRTAEQALADATRENERLTAEMAELSALRTHYNKHVDDDLCTDWADILADSEKEKQ